MNIKKIALCSLLAFSTVAKTDSCLADSDVFMNLQEKYEWIIQEPNKALRYAKLKNLLKEVQDEQSYMMVIAAKVLIAKGTATLFGLVGISHLLLIDSQKSKWAAGTKAAVVLLASKMSFDQCKEIIRNETRLMDLEDNIRLSLKTLHIF